MSPRKRISLGPGALVTAAFIGPGTITTATLAGASFGYALLWGMGFSILATYILQEMSSRLGLVTQKGLGEALHHTFPKGLMRLGSLLIVMSAIVVGNAAYQAGNITGAVLGITTSIPDSFLGTKVWSLLIALTAGLLLLKGSYRLLERTLFALVILMSLTFMVTAIIIQPDYSSILKGLLRPSTPSGSLLTLIGLIGTTVVPYNLFLHASAVSERWHAMSDLKTTRIDSAVSIGLGGLISMAIIVTSAKAFHLNGSAVTGPADLAKQLSPLLGRWAPLTMGLGLFAAGLTSAITAPLAAAYACRGILGWERTMKSARFRSVWLVVLVTGTLFANMGIKPLQLILFAQVANGILLPIIAIYLLWVVNNRKMMKGYHNSRLTNLIGLTVVLITLILGIKSIMTVFAHSLTR